MKKMSDQDLKEFFAFCDMVVEGILPDSDELNFKSANILRFFKSLASPMYLPKFGKKSKKNYFGQIGGAFYVSPEYPTPMHNDQPMAPMLQLDLAKVSQETRYSVGEGLLQVWINPVWGASKTYCRVIDNPGVDLIHKASQIDYPSNNQIINFLESVSGCQINLAKILSAYSSCDEDEPLTGEISYHMGVAGFAWPEFGVLRREGHNVPLYINGWKDNGWLCSAITLREYIQYFLGLSVERFERELDKWEKNDSKAIGKSIIRLGFCLSDNTGADFLMVDSAQEMLDEGWRPFVFFHGPIYFNDWDNHYVFYRENDVGAVEFQSFCFRWH